MTTARKITMKDIIEEIECDKKNNYSQNINKNNIQKYRMQKEFGEKKRIKP